MSGSVSAVADRAGGRQRWEPRPRPSAAGPWSGRPGGAAATARAPSANTAPPPSVPPPPPFSAAVAPSPFPRRLLYAAGPAEPQASLPREAALGPLSPELRLHSGFGTQLCWILIYVLLTTAFNYGIDG